ncbi:MAG: DUF1992 domain-containing protein [Gammaproteobacteria bacterium]|nr:DUF1992 domain-containing protein [Gammaproteobacteria bacterium]
MSIVVDNLAEAQIRRAMERGELDDLPGSGKPLAREADALVPEELRMAYRVLKNAGLVPEAVRLRGRIGELEQLIGRLDGEAYVHASQRLEVLRARLAAQRGDRVNLQLEEQYRKRVLDKVGRGRRSASSDGGELA